MVKEVIELPDELMLNIDDIKDQFDYKTREEFIIVAVKKMLNVCNRILLENC